jgi:TolA-binding protein
MKVRYLILAAALIPGVLYAQDKPVDDKATIQQLQDQVKTLKDQISAKDIQLSDLRMQLLQTQAGQVSADKQKAIQDLQASHPGMRWDDRSGSMVPIPTAPTTPPAAPAVKK